MLNKELKQPSLCRSVVRHSGNSKGNNGDGANDKAQRVYFMKLVSKDSGVGAGSDERISGICHRICKAECCVDRSIIAIPPSLRGRWQSWNFTCGKFFCFKNITVRSRWKKL